MKKINITSLLTIGGVMLAGVLSAQHETIPKELIGDWTLELDSGKPAWLSIVKKDGEPQIFMRVYVGPQGPHKVTEVVDGNVRFNMFSRPKGETGKVHSAVQVGIKYGKLQGHILRTDDDGRINETVHFSGKRIPPMPTSPPDLSKVQFGERISLFNGKDLAGWRPYELDKIMGWHVEDGLLVNTTPKTDFSATGAYANLRTEEDFEDFRLHIEFLIGKDRNSGIYLRGMYEAQVVDRDSRMQGLQGVGAIFSRIAPSENAGKPGGEWQTYDITLVDRHVTVVLNGTKVIDNQPVIGPTGGAINTDPMASGPIYLQGDHTSVKFRNIYLTPVVEHHESPFQPNLNGAGHGDAPGNKEI